MTTCIHWHLVITNCRSTRNKGNEPNSLWVGRHGVQGPLRPEMRKLFLRISREDCQPLFAIACNRQACFTRNCKQSPTIAHHCSPLLTIAHNCPQHTDRGWQRQAHSSMFLAWFYAKTGPISVHFSRRPK